MERIMELLGEMRAELSATQPEMKVELMAKWDAAAEEEKRLRCCEL
jgi:hypothetical protein